MASASPDIAGTFNPVSPTRILDTRSGIGATKASVKPGQTVTFDVIDAADASSVSAVALTVTAVGPTKNGYLSVYPGGTARPVVSNVNFVAGLTTPNGAIVPISSAGTVSIYNGSKGTVALLADLTGYWTGGTVAASTAGALHTVTPARIADTRTGAPVPKYTNVKVPVAGKGGVPATGVSAVVVDLAVATPTNPGYLTADQGPEQPDAQTSTVNFLKGQTRANLAVVPVNADGTIDIYNGSAGTAHIIVDVFAYFTAGTPALDGVLVPSTGYRAVDTRLNGSSGPLPALTTGRVALFPNDGTSAIFKAVVVTITVTHPQNTGFLTAWDGTTSVPPTSNVNFIPGEAHPSTMIVPIDSDGTFSVYNGSYGTLELVVDVHGFILNDLTNVPVATAKAKVAKALSLAHSYAAKHVGS